MNQLHNQTIQQYQSLMPLSVPYPSPLIRNICSLLSITALITIIIWALSGPSEIELPKSNVSDYEFVDALQEETPGVFNSESIFPPPPFSFAADPTRFRTTVKAVYTFGDGVTYEKQVVINATDGERKDNQDKMKDTPDDTILILTPLKNAKQHLKSYFDLLASLSYPHDRISLGFLVSDSNDGTMAELTRLVETTLAKDYRRVTIVERNFGFKLNVDRHAFHIQSIRRSIMARSRNHLLLSSLKDEKWVLWIDSDLTNVPATLIQDLLAFRKPIIVPNCYSKTHMGKIQIYDRNSWSETPRSRSLQKLLPEKSILYEGYALNTYRLLLGDMYPSMKELVPLHGVGGTVLLVLADAHRDGCVFSAVPFRHAIETEALGLACREMGYVPYGAPNYLIYH